jgi:hypothetical protein
MDTQKMKEYRTPLTAKLEELHKNGFTHQFDLKDGKIQGNDQHYSADQLAIVEKYRFEGESNPDDLSILYAIRAEDGTKGTIIDAYGTYANNELGEFMKGVKEQ